MFPFILRVKAFLDKYVPHWVILVLASGVGAALSYFQAEPNAQILHAFTSWAVAWPMLKGAGLAFAGTVIALLKKAPWSGLGISGSASGGGPVVSLDSRELRTVPPKAPPSHMRHSRVRFVGLALLALVGCGFVKAELPALNALDNIVVEDLVAGKTQDQIVADVAAQLGQDVCGTGAPCAAASNLVASILDSLLDSGTLGAKYPGLVEPALTMRANVKAINAARAAQSALEQTNADIRIAGVVAAMIPQ